jgi:predicted nucleotidyltransferase
MILFNYTLTITEQNILKTLGYFDLFQYPLTKEEICLFHPEHVLHPAIDSALGILISNKSVSRLDEFYSLQSDALLAQRRRKGNALAAEQMKRAGRVAKLLSGFPYVKGVAVSGSLSKNFADEKTDIDFFIITEANRLWIARTFMHLYKKLTFLTGRQHWYCMNYYVDEAAPEITEKNIFTAMEMVTLLPMQGKRSLDHFVAGNNWVKEFFPVKKISTAGTPEIKPGFFRQQVEKIFDNGLGDKFDDWLMKITEKRWQKKMQQHRLNRSGHKMSMVIGRHVSKPDPKNFQEQIVEGYRIKVQQLLQVSNRIEYIAL